MYQLTNLTESLKNCLKSFDINEEIDLDVLKIFGELYLEKEIGLDSGDLESLKLFGESVPSNLNLGTLEENLISLDVDPEDFGSWVVMTRGLHCL